jgi:hypothetical protein
MTPRKEKHMEKSIEFTDISVEKFRVYTFPGGGTVRIEAPHLLAVSDSGGHRVQDCAGHGHYVPSGWIHIEWEPKDGKPTFVF